MAAFFSCLKFSYLCLLIPQNKDFYMAKTLFLINAFSGKVRRVGFENISRQINEIYQKANEKVEIRKIDFNLLENWVQNAPNQGIKNIFAVGGDGTANAISAYLIHSPLNFGIIPMGSGNGFARNIGFSIHLPLAIRQSIHAEPLLVDTGVFGKHIFLNVGGVGIDADVAQAYAKSTLRGMIPYITNATKTFFTYPPQDYRLIIDGVEHLFPKAWAAGATNGTQWGYDAKVSPNSLISDGWLDVIIIKKIPLWAIPMLLGHLILGKLTDSRYVWHKKAKKIQIIRNEAGTAQVDGEAIEEEAIINIEIREKSLRLLLPNTLTDKKIESL